MERLLVKITKTDEVKFISHLDTMRTFYRSLKRANLPISYSQGFNPHPSISVAAPLSLGIESIGEYIDVEFDSYVDENEVKEKLNENLPLGMRVLNVIYIKEKKVAAMASVHGAKYILRMNHNLDSIDSIKEHLNKILSSEEILRDKKTKKGIREVNVRPLIVDLKVSSFNNEEVEIEALLRAGSNGSLGIDILASIIKDFSNNSIFGYPCAKRINLYSDVNGKWVDLLSFYK